jgi:hypothetical protein
MFTVIKKDIDVCEKVYDFMQEYDSVIQTETKAESGLGTIIVMRDGTIFLKDLFGAQQEFGHISDY